MEHSTKILLGFIFFLGLLVSSCRQRDNCVCMPYEECVDGACETKENHFRWGNVGTIIGTDLYQGVVEGNSCIDTVVFNVGQPSAFSSGFSLFVESRWGIQEAGINVNEQVSDTEYILGVGSAMCSDKGWYADIVCKLYTPDSVQLKFLFWTLSNPGEYIDSTRITLFK